MTDSSAPTRFAAAVLICVAVLCLFAMPAAAAASNSTTGRLIDALNNKLSVIAFTTFVLTQGLLFYATIRFWRSDEEAKPTQDNDRLEIAWTVATALILIFVGVASYQVLAQPSVSMTKDQAHPGPDAVQVDVIAQDWFWTYKYPGENITTTGALVVPTGRPIYFNITATDVIHSFFVPDLSLKQDAIPGNPNTIQTRITNQGTYRVYCAEYCGSGHSKMLSQVRAVSPQEYQQWLKEHRGETIDGNNSSSASISAQPRVAASRQRSPGAVA